MYGGPTVQATIMLLVCCQLSLLLALGLPALSHQNILAPHQRDPLEDNSAEEDILGYNAAPYSRYITKREQLQIPNMDNYNFNERFLIKMHILIWDVLIISRCALHRFTLMELHQMMEVKNTKKYIKGVC